MLLVLAVGMTYVIITAGIDLSVGAVLIFSGVVSAKSMSAVGGDNWGTILLGLVAALASGMAWGVVNGFLVAKAKIPPLIVTLGTLGMALGFALLITGGVDEREVPIKLIDTIGTGRLFDQIPYLVLIALAVAIVVRHRARRHALRPLHLRDRLQRRGGAARRHRRGPPPAQGLRPAGLLAGPGRLHERWPATRRRRSAGTPPTTCTRSPPS